LPAAAERPGRATTAARAIRLHTGVYVACAGVLIAVNWATGGGWWSFWPLGVWGVALGVHYMVYKTRSVDEAWVAERTADLHSKSYDAGHIDDIADRAREGALAPRVDSTTTPRE
jgi:type VI protein secretion system component VasK